MRLAKQACSAEAGAGVQRASNFELLRILSMLMIIADHYVVNSNLRSLFNIHQIDGNMIFLQLLGSGGMIAVNCFTLITGYFLSNGNWRFTKVLRLVLEIWFYRIVLNLILYFCGYGEYFTFRYLIKTAFSFVFNVNEGYVSSMLGMYLLIPYMNKLIRAIDRKQLFLLLCLLVLVYSVIPTLLLRDTLHYIVWLCTVYLFGAYIQKYPSRIFESRKVGILGFLFSAGLVIASILAFDAFGEQFSEITYDFLCSQPNKFPIFLEAVFLFLFFKNISLKNSRVINLFAASTFGIVLIHGNSAPMRQFIWFDLFQNVSYYNSPYLALHAFGAIFAVFFVCALIDMGRIRFIEKPMLHRFMNDETAVNRWIDCKIDKIIGLILRENGVQTK